MKAKEIEWKEISVLPLSANVFPPGKPYKAQMMLGNQQGSSHGVCQDGMQHG